MAQYTHTQLNLQNDLIPLFDLVDKIFKGKLNDFAALNSQAGICYDTAKQ